MTENRVEAETPWMIQSTKEVPVLPMTLAAERVLPHWRNPHPERIPHHQ